MAFTPKPIKPTMAHKLQNKECQQHSCSLGLCSHDCTHKCTCPLSETFIERVMEEFDRKFDSLHIVESWGKEDCTFCDSDWKKNKCLDEVKFFLLLRFKQAAEEIEKELEERKIVACKGDRIELHVACEHQHNQALAIAQSIVKNVLLGE